MYDRIKSFFAVIFVICAVSIAGHCNKVYGSDDSRIENSVAKIAIDLSLKMLKDDSNNTATEIDKAIEKYKAIIKKHPQCWFAYLCLGTAYEYKEDSKNAMELYKKIIASSSAELNFKADAYLQLYSAHQWIVSKYLEQNDAKRVSEEYKKNISIYEEAYSFLENRMKENSEAEKIGKILEKIETEKKKFENKMKMNKDLIETLKKSDIEIQIGEYLLDGMDEEENKNYKKAIEYFEKIGKLDSTFPVYSNLGRIYEKWDKYKKAIKMYNKAIFLEHNSLPSHIGLMDCYFAISKFDKVKAECEIVLKMDPENQKAKRYLKKINNAE